MRAWAGTRTAARRLFSPSPPTRPSSAVSARIQIAIARGECWAAPFDARRHLMSGDALPCEAKTGDARPSIVTSGSHSGTAARARVMSLRAPSTSLPVLEMKRPPQRSSLLKRSRRATQRPCRCASSRLCRRSARWRQLAASGVHCSPACQLFSRHAPGTAISPSTAPAYARSSCATTAASPPSTTPARLAAPPARGPDEQICTSSEAGATPKQASGAGP